MNPVDRHPSAVPATAPGTGEPGVAGKLLKAPGLKAPGAFAGRRGSKAGRSGARGRWPGFRARAWIVLLLLPLLITGCLRRISGTYKDPSGSVSLDFHRDGKVYAKVFGVPMVGNFEEKDNKIIFKNEQGDMFIDIIDANTLSMSHPLSAFTGELRLTRQK